MPITIHRARRVVDLVTDLSLQEAYTDALRALDASRGDLPLVAMEVGQSDATRQAAESVQAIEQQMAASTVRFTLEAVDRLRWNAHIAEYPPRPDDAVDANLGVDVSSLDVLIPDSIKAVHDATGAEVAFNPGAEWPALSAQLSDGQWSDFANAVVLVNRGTAAPKSKAASLAILSSSRS